MEIDESLDRSIRDWWCFNDSLCESRIWCVPARFRDPVMTASPCVFQLTVGYVRHMSDMCTRSASLHVRELVISRASDATLRSLDLVMFGIVHAPVSRVCRHHVGQT